MASTMQVFQISVSSTYGVPEFKENLLALYAKAGARGIPVTFLLTDNQIVNEKFLVFINDLLSTGYVADLCSPVRAPCACGLCHGEAQLTARLQHARHK